MSKIKDLLAIENDIDDLVPVETIEDVVGKIKLDPKKYRELACEDDASWNMINDLFAELAIMDYEEETKAEISDEDYLKAIELLAKRVDEELGDVRDELEEEWAEDNKYILDELREKQGRC